MKKFESSMIYYFVFFVGVMVIGVSIYFFCKTWSFKNKAAKTSGKIIDVSSRLGGKYKVKEYAPIIAFTTHDGNNLKFQSQTYTLFSPKIGEDLEVYYTLDPLHAEENTFINLWGIPFFSFILGTFIILFCLIP